MDKRKKTNYQSMNQTEFHDKFCRHQKDETIINEQLNTHTFDNSDETDKYLEKYKLPQLIQYKIDNWIHNLKIP